MHGVSILVHASSNIQKFRLRNGGEDELGHNRNRVHALDW